MKREFESRSNEIVVESRERLFEVCFMKLSVLIFRNLNLNLLAMKYDDSMMLDQLPPAWKNKKEEKIKKSQHPPKNRKITMLTTS